MAKTNSKSSSLSSSSQKSPFFAVLMNALYVHPRYFKLKQKYEQYGPCFQTIFPFLMTMTELLMQGGSLSWHVIILCGIKLYDIFLIVLPEDTRCRFQLVMTFSNMVNIFFFENAILHAYGSGKTTLRLNLANTMWWRQFWCKKDWTPDSNIKFSWEAKVKSMQENLSSIIWIGSWTNCSSLNWDVTQSILVSSMMVSIKLIVPSVPKSLYTKINAKNT